MGRADQESDQDFLMANHARAKELFLGAIARPSEERTTYLAQACGSDAPLRLLVEELLDAHLVAGRFLDGASPPNTPGSSAGRGAFPADGEPGQTESAGDHIGRYKLLQRIGEGGFGEVWMAEQTEPVVRRVALKVIKAGMDTRQVIARFEAERQALAMMDHPGIALVLDAGATQRGRPFFVMELVRGDPVTQYCDGQRLSVRHRLELFRDICYAVQHAHQKGIIHRDLKPSNVLVTVADGAPLPKVIDFGIAKATAGRLTDKTLFTEHRALIGTPAYMSPEQADMSGVDVDTRSDIYALGVLLFELLTGSTPFDPQRLRTAPFAEVQRIIREEEPPRPSLRFQTLAASSAQVGLPTPAAPDDSATDSSAIAIAGRRRSDPVVLVRALRGDLDWIVMKCLDKDRRRRYATASDLAEDVGRYLDHQPVLATPPSTGYRLRKFVRRHSGAVLAGAVVSSALIIAAGVSLAFGLSESRQRRAAEIAASDLEQVARFQQAQLSGIDVQTMGARIREDLLEKARAAAERSKLPAEEADARIAALEQLIAGSDFTGIALDALEENFFQPALQVVEEHFVDQPLVKARLLQTMASTLTELGLLDAAADPQKEALAIRRRLLGDEHRDTISSITGMGTLLCEQGSLQEAEPYLREAAETGARVLGEEHPETLIAMKNLGDFLLAQGKPVEAEALHREVLQIRRRVLGDDDLETVVSISAVGIALHTQGKLSEAEPYYLEALERYRQVRGEEHAGTLTLLNNIGSLLQAQGKLAEAEPYHREAVEKHRQVLGSDHPSTLMSINNMGELLRVQGKLAEAEALQREALEKRRRVLGEQHHSTLVSINNLAMTLKSQGKLAEAEHYYRESLEMHRRLLGNEHANTLTSINNLASLLWAQGKPDEAEPYFREALAGLRQVRGDEHPHTLLLLTTMGKFYRLRGDPAETVALLAPAEPAARRAFTDDNAVRLGRFLAVLGRARADTGEFELAEANLTEAHTILSEARGAAEPERLDVARGLIELYDAWHAAEPAQGHDSTAADWRGKLPPPVAPPSAGP
jgi:serine/threonine protein kinase/tetratricopeptide (TPR) repeat protein